MISGGPGGSAMENWRYFNIIFGSCVDFYNAQGSSWLPHDELDFGEWQKKLGGLQIEPFKELIQKISDWTNLWVFSGHFRPFLDFETISISFYNHDTLGPFGTF